MCAYYYLYFIHELGTQYLHYNNKVRCVKEIITDMCTTFIVIGKMYDLIHFNIDWCVAEHMKHQL